LTRDENTIQGDFGEKWLCAVASGCGLIAIPHNLPDLEKIDVEITLADVLDGVRNPCVKVQVKTTQELRLLDDSTASYSLDVDTYNDLRMSDQFMPRVLVVFGLANDGERVRLEEDGTLLVGRGMWVSLEGREPVINSTRVAIHLPRANTVDKDGLFRLLREHAVRRSTVVPEVSEWE
jgi:Domain of unknown function (DUF4365)